jgi:hypothetical protein
MIRLRAILRRTSRAGGLLAATIAVACHDASKTRVAVQYVPTPGTGVQVFAASLEAGQVTKAGATDASGVADPLELETPGSGFVVVTVALLDSLGTIGGGATAIELRPDAVFSVVVHIDSISPIANCSECLGAKSFVLPSGHQRPGATKDSIWLFWTATTTSGDAITK